MTVSPANPPHKVSLRLILIIPFVLEVIGAVGLTGWLAIQNGQRAIKEQAVQLEREVATRIEQHLTSYLSIPKQINQTNVEAIRLGLLDTDNQAQLERAFWQQTQVFQNTSYISFGREQTGGYVDAGRLTDGTVVIETTPNFSTGTLSTYTTDSNANKTDQVLFSTPDYDPRSRPWYTLAVESGKAAWTDIYSFVPDPVLGMTATVPVYDEARQLEGVLAVDLTLSDINQFLQHFQIGQSGEAFIIERSGLLIGTSTDQLPFIESNGQDPQRLNATDIDNPLIQSVMKSLLQQFGELDNIHRRQHVVFEIEGQQQFVQVLPFQDDMGLDWLIVVAVPESDFTAQINANTRNTILLCLGAIGITTILGILTSRWITKPIQHLTDASHAIANGDLDQHVNVKGIHELNVLAQSFNKMAQQLRDVFTQLSDTNAQLEQRVEERTSELSQTLTELQHTQAQVIQNEKMSSLGQLVAGVAHEINNPVNFIHGNLTHVQSCTEDLLGFVQLYQQHGLSSASEVQAAADAIDLEFLQHDLPKMLASMKLGTDRIRQIILSLRNFSRMDEAEYKAVDIHEGIDSTLLILQHRLKAKSDRPEIKVCKDYDALPLVECYAGQLNQVFMNILVNAIDAIDEASAQHGLNNLENNTGRIEIRTSSVDAAWVEIAIADNGGGIPEAIQPRIFDPFFTTKSLGKGTGMGMSISYQIITEKHQGKLECRSTPGNGTEFIIQIPLRQRGTKPTVADLEAPL